MNVAIFDYGVGNLHSLAKALEAGGARVRIEPDPDAALAADALVLPGVGAFSPAAARLAGGREAIRAALRDGFPCLGVCLGMQLLLESSEEGPGRGLGVVPGEVRRLRTRRVPHIGWNAATPVAVTVASADSSTPASSGRSDRGAGAAAATGSAGSAPPHAPDAPDPLLAGVGAPVVYYANGYVARPDDAADVVAWTEYEDDRFAAVVRRGRTWGVQFHPEKSGAVGLRIIRNFLAAIGTGEAAGARAPADAGAARETSR